METGLVSQAPRNLERARQSTLLDFSARLVGVHGPVAEYGSKNADFSPIETLREPNAKGTFVSFSSLRLENALPPAEFGRTLHGRGFELVFVKDFSRVWFQQGLNGVTSNRQETSAFLEELLSKLPRPWTFIGSSSGGYAALFFGTRLSADRVLAFAPQTLVDRHTFSRFAKMRPFEAGFKASDPENDLLNCMSKTGDGPAIKVFHGNSHYKDKRQAARIAELPNVSVVGAETNTHNIAQHLRNQGSLDDLLF
ncbi:hypothetical protein [Actibacterium pelagium]|uniref:Uncharacterized protein n=1 Tax=Actibacterium pelagium TaxID=2029103 RepID=A0A917AN96_9RHOB|nr:hypothetical protein [Actibacterium pelagium]GGE61186.1 hypothetical protein GCM10011517_30940 [Actibacterium pelagium]